MSEQERIAQLEAENERLRVELREASSAARWRGDVLDHMRERIAQLEAALLAESERAEMLAGECERLSDRLERYRRRTHAAEAEVAALRAVLEGLLLAYINLRALRSVPAELVNREPQVIAARAALAKPSPAAKALPRGEPRIHLDADTLREIDEYNRVEAVIEAARELAGSAIDGRVDVALLDRLLDTVAALDAKPQEGHDG